MKNCICILLLFAFAKAVTAQQDPQYSQYMYNPLVINPAYAGNRGVASIVGLHRSQWVGLDGAPRTQSLSFHTPMSNNQIGLGLSIVNDAIGPADESYIAADFSYTIALNQKSRLSFGLKAGTHVLNVNFNELNIFDAGDPRVTENVDNQWAPTLGLGIHYHTDRLYIGLSAPNLLETEHFLASDNASATYVSQEQVHYFLSSGYVFDINDDVKFKPATLIKWVQTAPLQIDISANFLFNDRFTVGSAYRWGAAVTGLVGYQISQQILIGFAYDRETTELGNAIYNDGSYEFFMRYELFKSYDQMITPRFF